MEEYLTKPPWENVSFVPSLYPQDDLFRAIHEVQYDLSWNEMDHHELNAIKQQIEPLEKEHQWETLKKKTNPFELIFTQESADCPPSIAQLKPLSRSYFKMIEILQISHFFDRLPKGTQKLRSSHVAEGPGGFIEAFLDRAFFRRLNVASSTAMTLKPTSHHVPGWKRAHHFLQKHPEVKIHYGHDDTGDLYVMENQNSFMKLHEAARAHLFTGDGGFDFSTDYDNQEKSAYSLLVASAIVGLQVLTTEGTFVLKFFDVFSGPTQYLIRLITFFFKDWTLYKPCTSRPCNSERYLICRGFRKTFPFLLDALYRLQDEVKQHRFPQTDFLAFFSEAEKNYLENHIQEFQTTQIENLKRTIQMKDEKEFSWKTQYQIAQKWCLEFRIPYQKVKELK